MLHYDVKIKGHEMCGTCSTHGRDEVYIHVSRIT